MNDLHSFFAAKHFAELSNNDATHELQIGKRILPITEYRYCDYWLRRTARRGH
jgi:hypothetical protein